MGEWIDEFESQSNAILSLATRAGKDYSDITPRSYFLFEHEALVKNFIDEFSLIVESE